MSKRKISIIAISVLIILATLCFVLMANKPEGQNYKAYRNALLEYNENKFQKAYYDFSKISRYSKLKPAAIYRQALCAEKLDDTKSEIKKYKEIARRYPNTILAIRAKYLKAQLYYETKEYKKARKEFKNILSHYPKTDYATAAQYYLGSIETENAKNIQNSKKRMKVKKLATRYFEAYLTEAPTGRFALNSAQKWVSLNLKLTPEDNLLIARIYFKNNDFKNSQKYLKLSNMSLAWPYLVQNAYAMKDFAHVKYYTEQGLREENSNQVLINESANDKVENENIYKAIDLYLKSNTPPQTAISYLLSIAKKSDGYDYLLYKSCLNMPLQSQTACFNTLYYKYPDGRFGAEALANIFYNKVKTKKYFVANKIGKEHLRKYPDSNSSPKVMFWLAKIAERTKNYDAARNYYKKLMKDFPDDYYSYHAFLNLKGYNKINIRKLEGKPIEFPYRNSSSDLIIALATVQDYGLINILCKDDEFIQSWLFYLQGDFSSSARIARDAMEKLKQKPDKEDPRWRLVYPLHYYDEIEKDALNWGNDPVLILSIIREESYFNPKVRSAVGASGLMQLMPASASEAANMIGVSIPNQSLLFDPEMNIRLGNIYYSKLKTTLLNKDVLAVLAYNGGIGSVLKWTQSLNYTDVDDFVEQIPYPETQNYLKKVYRSYWNYLRIYNGNGF